MILRASPNALSAARSLGRAGIRSAYDYGPLGVELLRNVKEEWWKAMVQLNDNIAGIDAAIFMHPTTWKASGHVDAFLVLMITATAYWLTRGRATLAVAAFVVAVMTKPLPVVLAPLFLGRIRPRDALIGIAVAIVLYLPFLSRTELPLGLMPGLVQYFRFNGPIYRLIAWLTLPAIAANPSGDKMKPSGDRPESSGDRRSSSGVRRASSRRKPGASSARRRPSGDRRTPARRQPETFRRTPGTLRPSPECFPRHWRTAARTPTRSRRTPRRSPRPRLRAGRWAPRAGDASPFASGPIRIGAC